MAAVLRLAGVAAVAGATAAAVVGVAAPAAARSGPGLEPSAGGGEEGLTLCLRQCPPRVLAMPGLETERRWREREEEDLCCEGKEMV